jgi:hypothetical protein
MLVNLLALVLLAGLTAASLLVCLAKWHVLEAWEVKGPAWFPRCDFCIGYWAGVLLLLAPGAWYVHAMSLPWYWLAAVLPVGLPAAAVCRAVAGDLG